LPDGATTGALPVATPANHAAMPDPAIILFCYQRAHYLNASLSSLASLRDLGRFSVYVSQDGNNASVASVVTNMSSLFKPPLAKSFVHLKKPRKVRSKQTSAAWISQHYKWGLSHVFDKGHSHVIVVEEDMVFSPGRSIMLMFWERSHAFSPTVFSHFTDFLNYFESAAHLLDIDPTLWCISSWNDNCYNSDHSWSPQKLFRNSYFPGLGWMLKRETWLELKPHWIEWGNWDEGLRNLPASVTKQRDCICPELSRNKNIGAVGANMDAVWFHESFTPLAWSTEKVRGLL
jgi:alpha-1,3-mannosyl-glycoprotein beta-1,2-N-acetylglucosaminyltransferase